MFISKRHRVVTKKKKKKSKIILRSENPSKMKMHFFYVKTTLINFGNVCAENTLRINTNFNNSSNDNSITTYSDTQCVLELSK